MRQVAYIVPRAHKAAALQRVLDMESPTSALVFCRTRLEVDTLVETLNAHGYRAEAIHGGMQQRQREAVMARFKAAKADLLIATDVAARGLDIRQLSHVFNYDVPSAPEAYIHRIGRTGRAGAEGVAITLAEPREHRLLRSIESMTKQKIEVATVPTVSDLRARRLELTSASIREQLVAGDLDSVRVVVQSLAGEFDVVDVAAAAVKLVHAHLSDGEERDERDVPSAAVPRDIRGRKEGDTVEGLVAHAKLGVRPRRGPPRHFHRSRPAGRHPASGPRGRDHQRGGHLVARSGRRSDRRPVFDRRGARGGGRRSHRLDEAHISQRSAGHHPARPGALRPRHNTENRPRCNTVQHGRPRHNTENRPRHNTENRPRHNTENRPRHNTENTGVVRLFPSPWSVACRPCCTVLHRGRVAPCCTVARVAPRPVLHRVAPRSWPVLHRVAPAVAPWPCCTVAVTQLITHRANRCAAVIT